MLWVSVVLKRLSTSLTSFIDLSNQDHVRLQKQKGKQKGKQNSDIDFLYQGE